MEIWKDVIGYEGFYQVSDHGRVRSVDRYILDVNGKRFRKSGKPLRLCHTRGGYLFVVLYKDGQGWQARVNRLVALNFIDNPSNLLQVGHKDDDKENNHANNLYWTDNKENSTHNGKHILTGIKVGKAVIGSKCGQEIRFRSSMDARRHGFNASAIRNCLTGLSQTHKGFTWRRA